MLPQLLTRSFRIEGDVGGDRFCGWIADHARKLGVRLQGISSTRQSLLVQVDGPNEMVDALMVACFLGPSCVMVDDVVLLVNSTNP